MSINKIYKIPLLLLTVGISAADLTDGQPPAAILPSTEGSRKSTKELIKDHLAQLTSDQRVELRNTVLSNEVLAEKLESNLGVVQALNFQKVIEGIRIKCNVTVKSLEFDSKTLTVTLNPNDTSLPTISAKIRQQLDRDPKSIYSTKFEGDRPGQQFQESDMSLVIYYKEDPVSKEFKKYIYKPDTQSSAIETPMQLNAEQLKSMQCHIAFHRLPLKEILKISVVETLLRRQELPTNEKDLRKVLESTCLNNRYDETIIGWACLSLNQTSTDDPLSYTLRRPISSLVKIVRIPRKLMNNQDNRVDKEQVIENSAEIIKILSPDNSSTQLLFDKRNSLLILKTTKLDWLSRREYYLLLNVGNDNQYTRVGNDDEYSSYAVMPIDPNSLFPDSYVEILTKS
jgi:hypothetical protein